MLTLSEQINHSTGTYYSIQPSIGSRVIMHSLINQYQIKNPIPMHKLHTTIIYSEKPCPNMRYHQPSLPIWGMANGFEKFGPTILVLTITSPGIEQLYKDLQIFEPTSKYPHYRAHMSLSYEYDGDAPKLIEPIPICYDTHQCVAIED